MACFCSVLCRKHLDQAVIENALAAEKDVDCMTDLSMSGVFTGKKIGFPPCTPQACMEILDHYGIDCTGKKAVVIGRSLVVGKPAAMMLVRRTLPLPSAIRRLWTCRLWQKRRIS